MIDFDAIAKKLTKEMDTTGKKPGSKKKLPPDPTQLRDGYGRPFNPEIHMNKRGKPMVSRAGFAICKRGHAIPVRSQITLPENYEKLRAAEMHEKEEESISQGIDFNGEIKPEEGLKSAAVSGANVNTTAAAEDNALPLGAASAEIIFILGMAIGGEEWHPSNQERATMQTAFSQYYAAKGYDDLPPGMILATALITYVAPRLRKPKTQSKIKQLYYYVRGKITRKQPRQDERKVANE